MTTFGFLSRLLIDVIRHPATHEAINHIVRNASAALIRHIRNRRNGGTGRGTPAF